MFVTGWEEKKRANFHLVLERKVERKDQLPKLVRMIINQSQLQILPL